MELMKLRDDADKQKQRIVSLSEVNQPSLQERQSYNGQHQGQEEPNCLGICQKTEIRNLPELGKLQPSNNQWQQLIVQKITHQWKETNPGSEFVRKGESVKGQVQISKVFEYLLSQVDNKRAIQLQKHLSDLRKEEITKENFLRHIKRIVGNQMLSEAVAKALDQMGYQPSAEASHIPTLSVPVQTDSSPSTREEQLHLQRTSSSGTSTINQVRWPQIHMRAHFQELPMKQVPLQQGTQLEGSMLHVCGVPTPSAADTQDLPTKECLLHQGNERKGFNQPVDVMNMAIDDVPKSCNQTNKLQSRSHPIKNSALQTNLVPLQPSMSRGQESDPFPSIYYRNHKPVYQTAVVEHTTHLPTPLDPFLVGSLRVSQQTDARIECKSLQKQCSKSFSSEKRISSATTSVQVGTIARTPQKRSFGKEKPIEAFVTPSPPSRKRQKVSGPGEVPDKGFELPDDPLCGIHLGDEEEQLFPGRKVESQALKAPERVAQVNEAETMFLQKLPLKKKVARIISKCGIKSIGKDVEHLLSLSVEERMHGLIRNMIRLSKQRVDFEKSKHRTVVTSDIQHQISVMNMKLKEDREKRQTKEGKLCKFKEAVGETGTDVKLSKDRGGLKTPRANEVIIVPDHLACIRANTAVREAIGGDDVISKWQLMGEKHNRGSGTLSGAQASKDGQQLQDKGSEDQFLGESCLMPRMKAVRSLCAKDVIAALGNEPQMSRSIFLYRLCEKFYGRG